QKELTRISDTTSFGGQKLLNGSFGDRNFQIGAQANETLGLELKDVSAAAIGRKYQSFESTTPTVTVNAGTESQDGTLNVIIGSNSHDIDLKADMTAEDVQQ